ncbi:iron chelate uptake ABC transporter family permease subunit [uncultured Cardiobacterium sp.]|uniref:iron chelate uptake ABC transporter family permease subunit n=1 Tax=uncultured Cardiobacterium sp. TaxID=417619 RepID=UPI003453EBFF
MPCLPRPLVAVGIVLYLTTAVQGDWGFVLLLRGKKLLAMLLVGSAIASATVVFQTLTANRILTPSIIGLDALYLLSKMVVIYFLGSAAQLAQPPQWQFYIDTALMTATAAVLFATFLPLLARDIYRLLLIGIIFGVLCNKLTDLMARMIDPTDYTRFQAIAYARFDSARADLILPAALIIGACLAWLWHKRHVLDILALGREQAINLGIHYPREQLTLMLTVALLVAVSTALVGPTLFFGLLASALACRLFSVPYHAIQLPAACLLACAILIIGQTLFERVFHFAATLSILIECIGGSVFLYLLLARKQP